MATEYKYVDYSILERRVGSDGWDIRASEQQMNDAATSADAWLDGIITLVGDNVLESDTLSYHATNKAACIVGTTLLGSQVREGDRPQFMSVCDECNRFEKNSNKYKASGSIKNKRIVKGVD